MSNPSGVEPVFKSSCDLNYKVLGSNAENLQDSAATFYKMYNTHLLELWMPHSDADQSLSILQSYDPKNGH